MTKQVQFVYYYNISPVGFDSERVNSLIEEFRENYLSDFGDNIIVVPSLIKEGFEALPVNS